MRNLSQRVLSASESQTLAIAARAKQMKKSGLDVISLSTGEPDFPTPDCAKQGALKAIEQNFTHYTESNGIPELRSAVANKFLNENNIINASDSTVLISCGAKHSIMNALNAICNVGDEVIVIAPYWVSYPAMVTITGATPVIIKTTAEQSFKVTAEQIRQALSPKTKCIIFNSPSNPTGMMYTRQEFDAIANVLAQHDCYILSDEIYEKIHYGIHPHISLGSYPQLENRVITVNGCSKAYAMTGWRIGFMNAPKEVFEQAAKIQSQDTSNPTSIAQYAALAALLNANDDVETMRKEFTRRRELVCGLVDAIGGVRYLQPDGAFYLWVDISSILNNHSTVKTANDFCQLLLDNHYLALVPSEAFGTEGYVRFSFAANDHDITQGVTRFARLCSELSS